jgi:hypothetical protein
MVHGEAAGGYAPHDPTRIARRGMRAEDTGILSNSSSFVVRHPSFTSFTRRLTRT